MLSYVVRRVLVGIVQVVAIALVTFVLLRLLPENPADVLAGGTADSASREIVAHQLGLDTSIPAQVATFVAEALHGSLGLSWITQATVWHEIGSHLAITVQIVFAALILSVAAGTLLGYAIAASDAVGARRGRPLAALGMGFILVSGSQPEFWWGLVLIEIFFKVLGWAPLPIGILSAGITPPAAWTGLIGLDALAQGRWSALVNFSAHMILPVATICFVLIGPIAKVVRESVLPVMASPCYANLRALGASRARRLRCVVRNGGAPVVMLIGVLLGPIIGGAALVETIFSIDGLAHLLVRSILGVDFPVVQGGVATVAAICIVGYIAADLVAAWLNPNLRPITRRAHPDKRRPALAVARAR